MAARKNLTHIERVRQDIRTTQLVKRLQSFVFEEDDPQTGKPVQLSRDQITTALGLIKKTLPDMTEVKGDVGGEIVLKWKS